MTFSKISVLLAAVVSPYLASAKDAEIKLVTTDFPPYSIVDSSGNSTTGVGVGVEVIQEITKRLSITTKAVQLSASRIDDVAKNDLAIFAAVTRTKARESQYRWIGKLTDDRYCLVMQKTHKEVSTVEGARELKAIGVNQNSGTEVAMDRLGLKNKDLAANNSGNVRKLFAGRIDAWFAPSTIVSDSIRRENLDPSKVRCSGNFGETSYWIAASSKLENTMAEKMEASFTLIEKEGVLNTILSKHGLVGAKSRP